MEAYGEAAKARIRRMMLQRLESLQRAGVSQIGRPAAGRPPDQAAPAGQQPKATAPPLINPAPLPDPSPSAAPARRDALEILQKEVVACRRCTELACSRTQTVFGVGDPQARLCFLGEAPGADEDRQGEPFVGRAGELLTKIIEACTLKRQDVYILNVLKCRPPGNRKPLAEETANCRGYFERQLEIIRPQFICCLGSVAAQALLETNQPIGRLRGRFHDYRGAKVLATYHPAYLLRTPSAKKDVWDDMKLLMAEMGIEIPARRAT